VPNGIAILGSGVALSALLIALTVHHWLRIRGEDDAEAKRELASWAFRGFATPILFLVIWNLLVQAGVLQRVVPLMPGAVINTRQYVTPGPALATAVGITLLLVSSFWSAFALAQLVPRLPLQDLLGPARKAWIATYALLVVPPAGLLLWWVGPGAVGFSTVLFLLPLLHVLGRPKPKPFLSYAKAVGRMKLGKYADAESAVIEELEKCADDVEGWMMLATLYAENFRDLESAEATLRELIEQPNLTPFQISQALNRLADWQLKLGENPPAARQALRELIARCEGTPFARNAEHRLAQLPLDREELAAQRTPKKLRLPSLSEAGAEARPAELSSDRREEARREFDRLHIRLGLQPTNLDLLERAAILQAEELGDTTAAIKGIEALLARPDRPADRVPRWLSHLATWQLKFRNNEPAARKLLEQLVREYPQTPEAFGASSQLWTLEQNSLAAQAVKAQQTAPVRIVVKLPGTDGPS
jgi:hypothetical protein